MSNFLLEVNKRATGPQSQITNVRKSGRVPGVVYGYKKDNIVVDAEYNSLLNVLKAAGTSNVVKLNIDGKQIDVIVREYQQDPVTDKLTHVDYWALDPKRTITTKVPIIFSGTSKAVKEQGGKLNIKNDQVSVRCLPADLPAKFEIDIGKLAELGKTLLIKDIKVADGVEVLNNANDPVINVTIPKKIKEPEPVVAEVAEDEVAEGEAGAEGVAPADGATPAEASKEGATPAEASKEGEAK